MRHTIGRWRGLLAPAALAVVLCSGCGSSAQRAADVSETSVTVVTDSVSSARTSAEVPSSSAPSAPTSSSAEVTTGSTDPPPTAPAATDAPTTSAPVRVGLAIGSSTSPMPAPGSCTIRYSGPNPLPDPACTPGAVNPDVTEDTITATICVSGWTTTVRPPTSVTNKMKVRSAASYSIGVTNTEYDHLVPLELGGAPDDPRNLWVEPGTIPNPKDDIETKLRKAVCAHLVPLADAQLAIASNWTTAYASLGLAVTGGHACLASEPTRCAP